MEEASFTLLGFKNCLSLDFNFAFVATQLSTEHSSSHIIGLDLLGKLGSGLVFDPVLADAC